VAILATSSAQRQHSTNEIRNPQSAFRNNVKILNTLRSSPPFTSRNRHPISRNSFCNDYAMPNPIYSKSAKSKMRKEPKDTSMLLCLLTVLLLAQAAIAGNYVSDPNIGSSTFDTSSAFKSLVKAVLIIAVLGAAAIYISKKVMPKVGAAMGKEMKVVETMALGARKHLYIVKVGSKKLLLGATPERITHLADLPDHPAEGARNE
jgi:flagellar biosynthetic protein FliO